MLTRITFDFAGERQLSRAFDVLEDDARDLTEPLKGAARVIQGSVADQFQSEGAHGLEGRWQDLSEGTKTEKEQEVGFVYPILVRSRRLREAFVLHGVREITDRRLVFGPDPADTYPDGTSVEAVAEAHQSGEGVPARRIVALSDADRRLIDREFVEFFSSRTRRLAMLG